MAIENGINGYKWPIEIVDLPNFFQMVIFQFTFCKRLSEGKFHQHNESSPLLSSEASPLLSSLLSFTSSRTCPFSERSGVVPIPSSSLAHWQRGHSARGG